MSYIKDSINLDEVINLVNGNNEQLTKLKNKMMEKGNYPAVLEITKKLGEEISIELLENCSQWYMDKDINKAHFFAKKAGSKKSLIIIGDKYKRKHKTIEALMSYYEAGVESLDTKVNLLEKGFDKGIELYESIGYDSKVKDCQEILSFFEKSKQQYLTFDDKKNLANLLRKVPNSKNELWKLTDNEIKKYKSFEDTKILKKLIALNTVTYFSSFLLNETLKPVYDQSDKIKMFALFSYFTVVTLISLAYAYSHIKINKEKKEIINNDSKAEFTYKRLLSFRDSLNTL